MAAASNISLKHFRRFLESRGLKHTRTNGSHEIWVRRDLQRPVIVQTNKDPIPLFIVKCNLRTLKETMDDLLNFIDSD